MIILPRLQKMNSNSGLNVSLLQFAEDALFFGEWSRLNASNLINILRCFEMGSGLKVNMDKSRLGVPDSDVSSIASSFGCAHGILPFIYLGLRVGRRMRFSEGWQGNINRFRDRLSLWKAKTLSVLDSIRRRFFWGHKENERGMNWVKWKAILLDPIHGGHRVGCLESNNLSLLGKWKFNEKMLYGEPVIKDFYGDNGRDKCSWSYGCFKVNVLTKAIKFNLHGVHSLVSS
uniref:Putative RNA-directed DNA polymerase, eukaryota, reverse transcriptase zinc-binding domain protein n=1 Tax=Tanacetum cinerariifolium TaxID=118510 RepID=A0A699J7U0_TANCI|nr:putative RNA-directed DNA polymerase, eukaryota, reverse transcriptase zinc-binding domain protein [Tanacetum cinerariifolium]